MTSSFLAHFKKERNRLILETISTAIAVLIALTIDSIADFYREKSSFHSMLHAVQVEARANQFILDNSFKPNYEKTIVYRPFTLKSIEQYWTSDIFIEHASPEQIELLSEYYLNLMRANHLRDAGQMYAYDEKLNAKFGDHLQAIWKNNLDSCESSLKKVLKMKI